MYGCGKCKMNFDSHLARYQHLQTHVDPNLNEFWNRQRRFTYETNCYTEVSDAICPFCQETIAKGYIMLGRHLGRHMEEISFAVVTKPYEEWKFYDDTISADTGILLHAAERYA